MGGLPDNLRESDHKIEIIAHEEDKPYIQGENRLNKGLQSVWQKFKSNLTPCMRSSVMQCRNCFKIPYS